MKIKQHLQQFLWASLMLMLSIHEATGQELKLALMKYDGGGDWYSDPTALTNLAEFCNEHLNMQLDIQYATVTPGSRELFDYPFVHLTGHGNVVFSDQEAENLRQYLLAGGFLHIDDNYGLDPYIRPQMKKVFPDKEFVALPKSHPVYHQTFDFPDGIPKIHEHDGKPPMGYGIFVDGRMVCYYSWESDLGDGWEDEEVHNDPWPVRQKALQMGANLIEYVFMNR
jgi:hypothetical protein